ncbi:Cytochrome c biogenesis protein CcdA [Candidatus Nitrotoga sp. HW29]|uniref:cytochrome c biogenesis protein DipZ n=1 Tax=Candidatus Nitrotoga sp. HW29 TaxID=2886963 RepID=UPI001EF3751A|nr:cytochrome c biogenesis protein DipZ [Candidatus Nitrotoga sp. HW29]CAH1903832.1 Cytochrome c biogenesis protein CcdA [Candidatus Nitrotoga sp. HW29]
MLVFFLAYLGGLLTIFSPCVLPVLPFIFARSDQSFRHSGLPILLGMAATFTLLASFAAVGGAWLVQINQYGRYVAMLLLLLLGIALIFPALSERLMRPFVSLGGRLQQHADQQGNFKGSLLLGVAVGFLWAPCAGPILGLVLAGAALNGANLYSALLLLVFAAGAATSLGLALLAGGRMFKLMKRGLGAEEWVRRGLGIAVVTGVVVIALGWDTRFLAQFTYLNTANTEQKLIAQLAHKPGAPIVNKTFTMPPLTGATQWLNSAPLSSEMLRGKVVLVDFWTYSCINCLRTLPYLKAWDEKYRAQGLVIIGVHAPEFAFEKDQRNVQQAIHDLGITYPVVMDNQYVIWNAYKNEYWPAHYLFDTNGKIRHKHFGEGAYKETEQMIQTLLKETYPGVLVMNDKLVNVAGTGATAAAADTERSPETYLGYARQKNLASPEALRKDVISTYSMPGVLQPNQWALQGKWLISEQSAALPTAGGAISYQFRGRDLHLVLGSRSDKPVRFKVTLDGVAPGANRGGDIDALGNGTILQQRLYQLIRHNGKIGFHTFRIEFLDGGAEAFAFTFG